MKTIKARVSITGLALLVSSCGLADDREAKGRQFLEQQITSESQGLIKLNGFSKTNGYDQEVMGTKMYVLEWKAEASIQAEVWKGGNNLIGYWGSFAVAAKKPSRMDSLMMASSPRRFAKGTVVALFGESHLRKTDNGWRVENLSVKKTQVMNEGHEFLGTWRVHYVRSEQGVDPRTGFVDGRWKETEEPEPLPWDMTITQTGSAFQISGGGRSVMTRYEADRLVEDRQDGLKGTVTMMDGNTLRWDFPDDLKILRRRPQ